VLFPLAFAVSALSGMKIAGKVLNLHGRDAGATKRVKGAIDGDVAYATILGGLRDGVWRATLAKRGTSGVVIEPRRLGDFYTPPTKETRR